jgi:hypothetical protein
LFRWKFQWNAAVPGARPSIRCTFEVFEIQCAFNFNDPLKNSEDKAGEYPQTATA